MFGIRVGRRPSRRLSGADHTRVYFSSYLGATGRHSGRPVVSSRVRVLARQDSTPFRRSQSPIPLDRPMINVAARSDSAREAVRKDARHPGGCRTSVTAGLTPYSNPTRRPTSTQLASKDAGLVSRDTV